MQTLLIILLSYSLFGACFTILKSMDFGLNYKQQIFIHLMGGPIVWAFLIVLIPIYIFKEFTDYVINKLKD